MFCLLVSINRTVLQQSWSDTWTCHFPFFIEQVFDFVFKQAKQIRDKRREEVLEQKRKTGKQGSPPHLIVSVIYFFF